MMRERGLSVDHTTISRWVQRYAPELDKRCRPHLKKTLQGYEAMNMIRKGQMQRVNKGDSLSLAVFIAELFGVAI